MLPKVHVLVETSRSYGRGLPRGIVRYARLHGPWSLHVSTGRVEQMLPKIREFGGSGVIARLSTPELAKQIQELSIPIVALAASRESVVGTNRERGIPELRSASLNIARMAAEHLLGCGFTQFAYCGIPDCPWSRVRETSFAQYIGDMGLPCHVFPHSPVGMPLDSLHENQQLVDWLCKLPAPIGVMSCNDDRGIRILQICAEHGIHVPEDVAVVGVDNDDLVCDV